MQTVVIKDRNEDSGEVHMPHPATERTDMMTLCGWVDVRAVYYDHEQKPVTCKNCIEAFRAIRRIKTPRGYIASAKQRRDS